MTPDSPIKTPPETIVPTPKEELWDAFAANHAALMRKQSPEDAAIDYARSKSQLYDMERVLAATFLRACKWAKEHPESLKDWEHKE